MNTTDKPVDLLAAPSEARGSAQRPPRWRTGRKVPINVYDENDRPVCQCHTAVDARRIVAAVNHRLRLGEIVVEFDQDLANESEQP